MDKKVKVFDKTFVPFIRHDELISRIDAVAEQINNDFRGCDDVPMILCILNGAIVFTGELIQRLDFPCQMVSTKMTSYVGTQTTGDVHQALPLTHPVKGRRVIIAEDIVDSGYTIQAMRKILKAEGATDVKVCTLLFKKEAFKTGEKIDYVAMEIPNKFILGFGLDYNELGRNLADIYVLDETAE